MLGKKKEYKIETVDDFLKGAKLPANVQTTPMAVEVVKSKKAEEDEDEGRSRFYMLCEIDAN